MDKKDKYWQLFLSTFKLSACTFGGGFVIIPLMRERFVKELHWIEEEETLDLTAIAQSSPGSIAINASILIGGLLLSASVLVAASCMIAGRSWLTSKRS